MIYVVGESPTSMVKIGVSDEPWKRLKGIQTGNPAKLAILATFPGERTAERQIHDALRDYRRAGEWFDLDGRDVVAEVSTLLDHPPLGVEVLDLRTAERRRILGMPPEIDEHRRPWSAVVNRALLELATTRSITRAELVALMLLVACADADGLAVATMDYVAEATGYARPVTAGAFKALLAHGYLIKIKRSVYRVSPDLLIPASPAARNIPAMR